MATVIDVQALRRESGDDDDALPVRFEDVSAAAFRIRGGVIRTSCWRAPNSSAHFGYQIHFKKEFRQNTGSFKERGARNAMLMLSKEKRAKGVIAASAGNHALGLAFHGRDLGIPVTVIMPEIAPITKVTKCRDLGARVIVQGAHIGESKDIAYGVVEKEGLTYINGYDDPHIIAGAGSIGLEILEQVPDVDAVIVPVGGAGLIAGISLAIKSMRPDVEVIGVEPMRCASFHAALVAGKPVPVPVLGTLADGLAVPVVGGNAFRVARRHVDRLVLVSEQAIALSVLRLCELEKSIIEGAGAAGLAAVVEGMLPHLKGKKIVIPLCGGNIDTTVLGRVIERGLAADGRLVRFVTTVNDKPGGIANLTALLASEGASIKDVYHERAWLGQDVAKVDVKCIIETRDAGHAERVRCALVAAGLPILWGPHSPQLVSSGMASDLALGRGPEVSSKAQTESATPVAARPPASKQTPRKSDKGYTPTATKAGAKL